jgi:ABC-type transporter Mla subunit MlaD
VARKSEARTRLIVGTFVFVLAIMLFISLFIIGQSEGSWETKAKIYTDFRTITGLRRGSPVQLAGVEVGKVASIDFVNRSYECDPLTEDLGRYGAGRTDNCEEYLFCAPNGLCADLEHYAAKGLHAPCLSSDDCAEDEVCVTKELRSRARRVSWYGPEGVCARYNTVHRRVQVTMSVFEDKLELIRSDSSATVSSNGVLGDKLVNIVPGQREPLGEDRRIQSTPSLDEDILLLRERIDGMTEKIDSSLAGISNLFSELNDERTIGAVKGIVENVDTITKQIADGEGAIGALISDPEMKEDLSVTLRKVRETAEGIESFVDKANGTLKKVDAEIQPLATEARKAATQVSSLMEHFNDPANKSVAKRLLIDKDGEMEKDLVKIVDDLEKFSDSASKVAQKLEKGEGTAGKLLSDPKAHDDLVKILGNLERNKTLKTLVRWVMEGDDQMRDSNRPPKQPQADR